MLRVLLLVLLLPVTALRSRASETSPLDPRYAQADVAPTKTSIYIGVVSMTMPTFTRGGQSYTAPYEAKVFPYFFYNEKGRLTVDIPDEKLARLSRGETIEFSGQALRDDGEPRRVEGRAVPQDAITGALKVRVYVSKQVQLVFNTTYRFIGPAPGK